MSILNFWKSLLPSFGKDRIIDDISRMRNEVDDSLLPSLVQAQKSFHSHPLKSSLSTTIERAVQRATGMSHLGLFDILVRVYTDLLKLLDALEQLVESSFAKDVAKEALTYRRANILRFLEVISFTIAYTTRVTIRIIAIEAATVGGTGEAADGKMSDREREYFDSKYGQWLGGIEAIDQVTADAIQKLESVPDVMIDHQSEAAVSATMSKEMLDPMKLNFITPTWNPIYKVRMGLAEWDVSSVNRGKEERKMVELRLRELKIAREGKTDARLELAIEVSEDRLKKLDFRIAKISGDVG